LQLLSEALVFNIHALHRNLHLAGDSPNRLRAPNAEMIALPVEIKLTQYNFCRVHQTLRVTPAMEAGLSDHIWSLEELVGLLDARKIEAAA
jgi:hypothetical protein